MSNTTINFTKSSFDIYDFSCYLPGGSCCLSIFGASLMEAVLCNLDWLINKYRMPNSLATYRISVRSSSSILGGIGGYVVYVTSNYDTHSIWVYPVNGYDLIEQDVVFDKVEKKVLYDNLNPKPRNLAKIRKPLDDYLNKKVKTYRWRCDGSASTIYIHYDDGDTFARFVSAKDAALLARHKDRAIVYLIIKYYDGDDINTDWMTVR